MSPNPAAGCFLVADNHFPCNLDILVKGIQGTEFDDGIHVHANVCTSRELIHRERLRAATSLTPKATAIR